ncbi:MAG: hypothetical protein ABR587_08855 [Candidatus Binatia bacterium]
MRKTTLLLPALIALGGFHAGAAHAACDFDLVRAKGLKTSMVRVYAACPSTDNPSANTQTDGGTEACTPVTPAEVGGQGTLYSYGPHGGCTVSLLSKVVSACEDLEDSSGMPLGLDPGACHVTRVKAKCKDMLSTNGIAPIGLLDVGFKLSVLTRVTLGAEINGDMTVIDYPVTFDFETPNNGGMKLKSSTAEALAGMNGLDPDLPGCTSVEIVDITIKDPGGRPFARMGGATAP